MVNVFMFPSGNDETNEARIDLLTSVNVPVNNELLNSMKLFIKYIIVFY